MSFTSLPAFSWNHSDYSYQLFAFLGSFVLSTFIDLSYYYYYYTYMHTTASKKNNNTIYCEFLCTSCLFDTYYNSQEIMLMVFLLDNDCIILFQAALTVSRALRRSPTKTARLLTFRSFRSGTAIYDSSTFVCCSSSCFFENCYHLKSKHPAPNP